MSVEILVTAQFAVTLWVNPFTCLLNMKICILSDSHDNRHLLDLAVIDAKAQGAEAVLHCGDIVAPTTLRILLKHALPIHAIHGNNTGDIYNMTKLAAKSEGLLRFYGQDAGIELAGKNIFIVHYPHYARAMATTGDWDLVCCGHDHRVLIEPIDNIKKQQTLYINPGTVAGVGADPTYVIGQLDTMEFKICSVPVAEGLAYNTEHVAPHS